MSAETLDDIERHRADLARANAKGMTLREFRSWRSALRRDYRSLESPGKVAATVLAMGALFMLLDPDALLAVTFSNRAMTSEEWAQYSSLSARRRKPGENVDDDEERDRRKRVVSLMQGIHGDAR